MTKNFLLKNMFFHDIFNQWHHFLTFFVTNSSSYGHSSNLEWTKNFLLKNMFYMTFSTSDITSSLVSLQTLVVMAIVPIWNHQKIFLVKNRFFHHIFDKWHHFVISFVTNSRGYGHSSYLEITKQFFIEKYVFPWHFEQVTSLPHLFRHKIS